VNLVVLYKKDGAFFYRYAEADLYKALLIIILLLSSHFLPALNFCPIHVSLKNLSDTFYTILLTYFIPVPIKVLFMT
jgi:hypothetical protein